MKPFHQGPFRMNISGVNPGISQPLPPASQAPAAPVNDHDADDGAQAAAPKALLAPGQGKVVDIQA
jgi:hypothetical protein